MDEHAQLRRAKFEDLTISAVIDKIVFVDGSELE